MKRRNYKVQDRPKKTVQLMVKTTPERAAAIRAHLAQLGRGFSPTMETLIDQFIQETGRGLLKSTSLLVLGQHLFTRDGRTIGNAIITEVTSDGLFRIETDFGNGGSLLNAAEIADWWHTTDRNGHVRISDVTQWKEDRTKCQANTQETQP